MKTCRHLLKAALLAAALIGFQAPAMAMQAEGSVVAAQPTVLIHAGKLHATPGKAPLGRQTVVVRGNRIVEVRPGFADAASFGGDVRIVDLSDKFVMPGMMDVHMHLSGLQDMNLTMQSVCTRQPPARDHSGQEPGP